MSNLRASVCKKLGLSATASQGEICRVALSKIAAMSGEKRGACPRCGRSIPFDPRGRLEPHTYVTGAPCPDSGELPKVSESWRY